MPLLETPRLFIRPLTSSDFEDVHRLHSDPLVVHWLFSGEPPSRQDTQEKMDRYVRDWRQNRFGFFGVFLKGPKQTGEFAGRAGLRYFEDTTDVEYGLCLFSHVAGRGVGPELSRAILHFAFKELKLERVVALIRAENRRSIRALEKIGFTHVENREYSDRVKGVYEVHASQFGIARQSDGIRTPVG